MTMTEDAATPTRSQDLSAAGAPPVPEKASAEQLMQIRLAAELQIDTFMKMVGYANPAERTDEQGNRWFELGSAKGHAGVVESDGELFLFAAAPLMALPSDKELMLPLMRELLETNTHVAGSARLGIKHEHVVVTITRPIADLAEGECASCIKAVMIMADSLDDSLKKKYGGTSKKRVARSKGLT
jgi:hypothetical protein